MERRKAGIQPQQPLGQAPGYLVAARPDPLPQALTQSKRRTCPSRWQANLQFETTNFIPHFNLNNGHFHHHGF